MTFNIIDHSLFKEHFLLLPYQHAFVFSHTSLGLHEFLSLGSFLCHLFNVHVSSGSIVVIIVEP